MLKFGDREERAWVRGFLFAYYLERGFSVTEAHAKSGEVPEHLMADLPHWIHGQEAPDPVG